MLADNYELCLMVSKTPVILNEYNKVFDEYLNFRITDLVKNEGIVGEVVYLPHNEVLKEDGSTTKLRKVFDTRNIKIHNH